MKRLTCQLCVCGGGSAGVGAAIGASRRGVDTLLIERDERLGGTSVNAGVNCWEPVAGATGLPRELYERMRRIPDGAAIYSMGRHRAHPTHNDPPFPGGELEEPYGIPFRCLIPKGFDNLLVAGRVAGFSSIAASSCRLSRTMIQLGEAAGAATALAIKKNVSYSNLDVTPIRYDTADPKF